VTLTLTGGSFVYDGTPHPAKAVATRNGIDETDDAVLTIDYTDAGSMALAGPPVDAGSYYAIATYSDGDVNLTVAETLIVTPAPLLAVAASASVPYGAPLPILTATVYGVQNSDNITATASSPAMPGSSAGTYPVIPAWVDPGGKLANYSPTSVNGTLAITMVPLVAVADSLEVLSGQALPPLTATVYGLENADSITATASTTATASSLPGSYPISVAFVPNAQLANYTRISLAGTLTISPVTVSAARLATMFHDASADLELATQQNAAASHSLLKAQTKLHQLVAAPKVVGLPPAEEEFRVRVENVPPGRMASIQVIKDGRVVKTLTQPDSSGMFVFQAAPGEELVALMDGIPFERQRV